MLRYRIECLFSMILYSGEELEVRGRAWQIALATSQDAV